MPDDLATAAHRVATLLPTPQRLATTYMLLPGGDDTWTGTCPNCRGQSLWMGVSDAGHAVFDCAAGCKPDTITATIKNQMRFTEGMLASERPHRVEPAGEVIRLDDHARPPQFSDEDIALRFAAEHANDLRYIAGWSRWNMWDGTRWKVDDTLHAISFSRALCRAVSSEAKKKFPGVARGIASAKTVAAIERLAKADLRLMATVDQWDADLWLLNTPGGTIELQTARMRPHRREDYCTKVTAVAPGGECPLWLDFLDRITAGDRQLQGFLKRMAGYALTGSTCEQALFFGYGTGGNGKGVFVNVISGVMNDYHVTAPMETFVDTKTEHHPTELAGLRGGRLVTATETEKGRRWAESKIKALTGGDTISARFMRQDFFKYRPQFKLLIVGNHKPGLRGVDEAIRRRMHLIPFTVTFSEEERDLKLEDKLRAEWPGILQWMIDGCAEWQREGLAHPEAVQKATSDYLDAEDSTGLWLAERCTLGRAFYEGVAALFGDWKHWAEQRGEFVGTQKAFHQALEARALTPKLTPKRSQSGHAGFTGLKLIDDFYPECGR